MVAGLKPLHIAALIAVAGVIVYALGRDPKSTGASLGGAAVEFADGLSSGFVFGVGDIVGLDDTREQSVIDQGRAELASGDFWNASFHLPAGEFISGSWSKLTGN